MQKQSSGPSRSRRTRENIGAKQGDSDIDYLRFLVRRYDEVCPGERERLYLAAEERNVEPLDSALLPSHSGSETLWQILAESFGLDVATSEEAAQRAESSRALKTRPRKRRQGRARKQRYDTRMRKAVPQAEKILRSKMNAAINNLPSSVVRSQHLFSEAKKDIRKTILEEAEKNTDPAVRKAGRRLKREFL